jgi:hypothetical protein
VIGGLLLLRSWQRQGGDRHPRNPAPLPRDSDVIGGGRRRFDRVGRTIVAMTNTLAPRAKLTDRWPTGLALIAIAGAVTVIVLSDRDAELFGPSIAVMAGIYLMAYALGRPRSAWLAFAVLSVVMTVLQIFELNPPVGITAVVVALWLWTVALRRYRDTGTFSLQTAGMVGFGAITLVCAAVDPVLGTGLAGVGFLAHGVWDAYHFRTGRVVHRSWSEFCGVVDLATGIALLVAAAAA